MFFNVFSCVDVSKINHEYYIVNTHDKCIFQITKCGYKILERCKRGTELCKISNNHQLLDIFLKEMEKCGVGTFSETKQIWFPPKFQRNKLDMVWLPVTDQCNYRCIHCYANANEQENQQVLSIKDYLKFFKLLTKKFEVSCVQITGGEPLLKGKEFIFSLISLIESFNIHEIEIYSNLSLLDEEYISFFKAHKIKVATSFYSSDPQINDTITKTIGSFNKSINSIEKLIYNGIKTRIGIVMLKANQNEAATLREWLNKRFGLSELKKYDVVRPMGRGGNTEHVPFDLFESKFVINKQPKFLDFNRYFYNKIFNSCWGNKICLKPDGNLYPCVMSSYKLGKYSNVLKILSTSNSYRYLNKNKIATCNICKYKFLCDECRAMSDSNRNILKNKPFTCFYNPNMDSVDDKKDIKEILKHVYQNKK